jgi:hypothetical protein
MLEKWMKRAVSAAVVALAAAPAALAQESLLTPAATQPAVDRVITKHAIEFTRYRDDPTELDRSGTDVRLTNVVSFGLSSRLSASAEFDVGVRDVDRGDGTDDSDDAGPGDLRLSLKYRFWQEDPSPVDTIRLALDGGAELPTGVDAYSSDSVDPFASLIFMTIRGRHGLNAAATYTLTTGAQDAPLTSGMSLADELRFDSAYLYRLSPAEYGAEFVAATYALVEFNAVYETNGDYELFVTPGVLYEAPDFALEAGVSIPVGGDVEDRPEVQYAVKVGIRFLF